LWSFVLAIRAPDLPPTSGSQQSPTVGLIQRIAPIHIPVAFEGAYLCGCAARTDDTRTRTELGVVPYPIQVTLADSVRWLVDHGHISRQASRPARHRLTGLHAMSTPAWSLVL
jgi:hypothetical protein